MLLEDGIGRRRGGLRREAEIYQKRRVHQKDERRKGQGPGHCSWKGGREGIYLRESRGGGGRLELLGSGVLCRKWPGGNLEKGSRAREGKNDRVNHDAWEGP